PVWVGDTSRRRGARDVRAVRRPLGAAQGLRDPPPAGGAASPQPTGGGGRMTMPSAARPSRAAVALATSMWAVFAVGVGSTLVVRAMSGAAVWQAFAIPFTAFATVGWLVAVRRPREPIGWLFL